MKIVSALMISVILFSVASFTGCVPPESNYTLSVEDDSISSSSGGAGAMGIQAPITFNATVKRDNTPLPDVQVCFAITGGPHNPRSLVGNESYERAWCEWGEAAMYKGEHLTPLISEHWKREKVYSATNNWVYSSTGPGGEPAGFAYTGIKPGTDTIVISANVSGHELEKIATITWQYAENTCVLDLTNNTLSPTNNVVTTVEPLGNGKAVVAINMGAGNYSVLEMKIEIQDPQGKYLLNIGDSPTNDGGGGDAGSFSNDSELEVVSDATYPNFILQLYANQYFSTPGAVVANLVPLFPPSGNVTTWILRVKIADQKMCALVENTGALRGDVNNPAPESPYIFRLGGLDKEASGGLNDYTYYAAFNRVIYTGAHPDRTGSGVTKVTFKWRTTWPGWEI
jgi:hypothetical protein